jgi:hypothetical protein
MTVAGGYNLNEAYDGGFFDFNGQDSRPLARFLAPQLIELLHVRSAVDFGCGAGVWVEALHDCGLDVLGVEGSENAAARLRCPAELVQFHDLRLPLNLGRTADLTISIEVAEHIEDEFAEVYVDNLVSVAPRVIFMTAAPPGQGGVHHVNLQPKEYWTKKIFARGYFRHFGYEAVFRRICEAGRQIQNAPLELRVPDCVRQYAPPNFTGVWIPFWMPANLLIFCKQ